MKSLLIVAAGILSAASAVGADSVLFSQTLDFNDNQMPAGWAPSPYNYGRGDFANGRLNAYVVDSGFGIVRSFPLGGVNRLEVAYDENLDFTANSMGSKFLVTTSDGRLYEFSHHTGSYWGPNMFARIRSTNLSGYDHRLHGIQSAPNRYGVYRHSLTLQDGMMTMDTRFSTDALPTFSFVAPIPEFSLQQVVSVSVYFQLTTHSNGWIDNVEIVGRGAPVDTTPPTITSLAASLSVLWPANHRMVPVTLQASAIDNVGVTSLRIVAVASNEPDNGLGDGDTANDVVITGPLSV
ncbi:MAG: hypothetical protein FJ170_04485, partial [Gammaproteobacteria bacterium]|nr:hypothetical protein [Gammaproteobacteria bacterium]